MERPSAVRAVALASGPIVTVNSMLICALWPWQWGASAWSALTFVVLVAAAVVAWRQVKEAQRLREEQARPFVIIDFDPFSTLIELTITNTGTTLARNVQFEFTPPLTTTHDDMPGRGNLMDLNVFKNGIPSLAPGKEIRLFFDQFPARIDQQLTMTYDVQMAYRDPAGRPYSEPTVLDLSMYIGTGGVTRHGLDDIHKQLKVIADNVKQWTDISGLKVITRADLKQRKVELDAFYAEQEEAASAAEGAEGPSNGTTRQ